MYTERFSEVHDLLAVAAPTEASAQRGNHTSDWLCVSDYHRIFALYILGGVAPSAQMSFRVYQATDANGTGKKPITGKSPPTVGSEDSGSHIGIEIRADELDYPAGYCYVQFETVISGSPDDVYIWSGVVFGIVSRYEGVGVEGYLYLMP